MFLNIKLHDNLLWGKRAAACAQGYESSGVAWRVHRDHGGSGKSTLLNISGILDFYDSGEYYLETHKVIPKNQDYAQNALFVEEGILYITFINHYRGFFIARTISPIQSTGEVAARMIPQSAQRSGTTLNISPPTVTISHWPANMTNAINRNPPDRPSPAKADLPLINALALNMFQNCNSTKIVKKSDNS